MDYMEKLQKQAMVIQEKWKKIEKMGKKLKGNLASNADNDTVLRNTALLLLMLVDQFKPMDDSMVAKSVSQLMDQLGGDNKDAK